MILYTRFCFLAQWDYYTYYIQCAMRGVVSMRCSMTTIGTRRGRRLPSGCHRRPGCTLMYNNGAQSILNLSYSSFCPSFLWVLTPECWIQSALMHPAVTCCSPPKIYNVDVCHGQQFENSCIQYYPILPYSPLLNPTCNATEKSPTQPYSTLNKHIQNA